MTLQHRLIAAAALVALPAGLAVSFVVDRLRMDQLTDTLENVVSLQVNDQVRERCESDPVWFLTGPLEGRPRSTEPKPTNPDAIPPRPHVEALPYELFAYDDDYLGSSPAAPRFPVELKRVLREGATSAVGPFDSPEGRGVEMGIRTSWVDGPCQAFLGRLRAWPHQRLEWWLVFLGSGALTFGCVMLVGTPTTRRLRRLSTAARAAARDEWTVTVPADGHDEITAVGAVFNEATADLRRRITDLRERDEQARRVLARFAVELAGPLQDHEIRLGDASGHAAVGGAELASAVRDAHDLSLHFGNLLAAAGLRLRGGLAPREAVTMNTIVDRARARCLGLARVSGVAIEAATPASPIVAQGDAMLFEQAIVNLVDNAIRFNRQGGHVRIELAGADGGFRVSVVDDGPGMTDEKLAEVTAIRRFRGDEGKTERVRQRGLGLALVWEIAERFDLRLALRRHSTGGVEAELEGREA